MNILGLDVSSRAIGWAMLKKDSLVASGAICVKTADFEERMFEITNRLKIALLKRGIVFDAAAIERPVFVKGVRSTAMIHQTIGAVKYVARSLGIRLKEISPKEWKAAIHKGNDDKAQTRDALISMGYRFQTCMDDETDAIGLALAHYYMITNPEEFEKKEVVKKPKKKKATE